MRNCRFLHNEMGLLTNNDPATVLDIEDSEFAYNQRPDGHNHNLYVGQIARLSVTDSYFHHAHIGHLLKSRAAVSRIVNNRLIDGAGGTASYELEFPNGGMAYVAGNTIAQSMTTENPILISFGAEGYKWPYNEIDLENNTLVNPLPFGGVFLRVTPGADAIRAVNNRLAGHGTLEAAGPGEYRNNIYIDFMTVLSLIYKCFHSKFVKCRLTMKTLRFNELTEAQTRQYIDAEAAWRALADAQAAAAEVRGSMMWRTQAGHRYLIRVAASGGQTSLGPHSPENERIYEALHDAQSGVGGSPKAIAPDRCTTHKNEPRLARGARSKCRGGHAQCAGKCRPAAPFFDGRHSRALCV